MKKLILMITLVTTQLSAFPYLVPEELGAEGSFLIDANDDIKLYQYKHSCVIIYNNNVSISKFSCKKIQKIIDNNKVVDK